MGTCSPQTPCSRLTCVTLKDSLLTVPLLLHLDVAKQQHRAHYPQHCFYLILTGAHYGECFQCVQEVLWRVKL